MRVRLRASAHSPYVLDGSQHTRYPNGTSWFHRRREGSDAWCFPMRRKERTDSARGRRGPDSGHSKVMPMWRLAAAIQNEAP